MSLLVQNDHVAATSGTQVKKACQPRPNFLTDFRNEAILSANRGQPGKIVWGWKIAIEGYVKDFGKGIGETLYERETDGCWINGGATASAAKWLGSLPSVTTVCPSMKYGNREQDGVYATTVPWQLLN
ncbi:MAG: hypothetical protein WBX20_18735 [Terrimicrobiaceae bacterium]